MNDDFKVHVLNEDGLRIANDIAVQFQLLLDRMEEVMSPSRELSLVRTHLQDACFWAKRGIAIDPKHQKL
jgi:hypothetical protein